MMDLQTEIERLVAEAIAGAFGEAYAGVDPLVQPTGNPRFGDYQANVAMSLAKRMKMKPRDVAQRIAEVLSEPPDSAAPRDEADAEAADEAGIFERVEVAGPGFINLTLSNDKLERRATAMAGDPRLGVSEAVPPRTIVVDYSGPNVAKEMHIGHLRSTILGDAIARILRFQGHHVIGQNHLGDWGTQFGMLIEYLVEKDRRAGAAAAHREIGDLHAFYQAAKQKFDDDPEFAERARQRVVALQTSEEQTLARWRQLVAQSRRHFDAAYERLGVETQMLEYRPESSYNDMLEDVVNALENKGLLKASRGAKVVFPHGFTDREGQPLPMIVRKTGGGYLYATTDLAAARYRLEKLGADRIIYVTDARQTRHFAMLFQTLAQAGWQGEARLDHVPFGAILGRDRKPFKTRSGDVVKLAEVLEEAEQRAARLLAEKNPDLPAETRVRVAHVVGIGALKYADLSTDRIKDYVFDWDRMLALEGNTAPYLQNAYVRIRSIFRKAGPSDNADDAAPAPIRLTHETERSLVLHLQQLPQVIAGVTDSLEPHRLCTYLYEVAATYHQFYENCPVLAAPDEATRRSRLTLSALVARTLRQGLDLLGIGVVERM